MFPSTSGTELLPLIQQGDQLLIDARLLHTKLQVRSKFYDWIVTKIRDFKFEENVDFTKTEKKVIVGNGGHKTSLDYYLTVDMAKELAMLERSDTGRQVRRYFIQKEKEARIAAAHMPPPASEVFAAIEVKTFNNRKMYPYYQVLRVLGYANGGNWRLKTHGNHFLKMDNIQYITEEYASHIYFTSVVRKNNIALKHTTPVIPANFGAPIPISPSGRKARKQPSC